MIKKYLDQNGQELWEVYVCIYSQTTSERCQKRKKGIKTEALAKKLEAQLLRDCERELLMRENRGMTWYDLVEKFELHIRHYSLDHLSGQTKADYIKAIRKYTAHWYERDASGITGIDVRNLFQSFKGELSITFQLKVKQLITNVFQYGIDNAYIKNMAVIPTANIKMRRKDEKIEEVLTIAEIKKLLSSAKEINHRWYPIWAFALLTGMRNGEIFALTWDDVDLENNTLTVSKSYNKRMRETKSTKSGYWRQIPISPDLAQLLRDLKLTSDGRKFVLPRIRTWGEGLQAKELKLFCVSIGLPAVKFHTLRACFATQLIRQGVPPIQIQKICGWADLGTMQRYIRMSAIDVAGVTDGLKILPEDQIMGKVVNLFTSK